MRPLDKFYHKLLSVVLALTLFVTTTGLNIYTHSCGCCKSFDVSLTAFDECCPHEAEMVCSQPSDDHEECCSEGGKQVPTPDHQCKSSGCCDYQHHFLKMTEDFQFTLKISIPRISEFPVPEMMIVNESDSFTLHESFVIDGYSLPPPLPAGRVFHVMTQSLKIAPPSLIPVRKICLG